MANFIKASAGTEAAGDVLVGLINGAMGYPRKGAHVGFGRHVNMPDTWDGTGQTPPGWQRGVVNNWTASSIDAIVPISDALSVQIQANISGLSVADQLTVTTALSSRTDVDVSGGTYIPKANAVSVQSEAAGKLELTLKKG